MSDDVPIPSADAPVIEAPPPVEAPPPAPLTAEAEEATLDAELAAQTIDLPEGEKLVPLSAVQKLRTQLKAVKAGTAEAETVKTQLAERNAQLAQALPLAQAFEALRAAQSVAPPPAPVEDTTELDEIARDFDFYTADGKPDLERARRVQTRASRIAMVIAQAETAPLVRHTLNAQARENIALAKQTKNPDTGQPIDPAILDGLFARIAAQPTGTATLADRDQVKILWALAKGLSPGRTAPAADPDAGRRTAPLMTERAGGQTGAAPKALSATEERAAKDAGLTQKQYLDMAAGMKW